MNPEIKQIEDMLGTEPFLSVYCCTYACVKIRGAFNQGSYVCCVCCVCGETYNVSPQTSSFKIEIDF